MNIVIATGGSGGHLFPALRVARELKKLGHDIVLFGSFERAKEKIQQSGFSFQDFGAKGFQGIFHKTAFVSVVAMTKAIGRAYTALKTSRPNVVIGFGGYGAFPVVLSATFLRIPTLIHEQNVVPGRANAILGKFVKKIAISFSKSQKYFIPNKTVLTGCPCHLPGYHADRHVLLDQFSLKENKITLLILGGSQGSQRINEVMVEAVKTLKDKLDFQVVHVCGKHDYSKLQGRYNELGIPFALFEFLDKMEEAYTIADLVISRSGAVTVSEIAGFQLPAILIPYPYAQGHQRENASVLCETNTSRMIEEKDCSAEKLTESILDCLNHPLSATDKQEQFKDFHFPDAARRLAQEALKLV